MPAKNDASTIVGPGAEKPRVAKLVEPIRAPELGNILGDALGDDFETVVRSKAGHVEVLSVKASDAEKVMSESDDEEVAPGLVEVFYARHQEFLEPEDAAQLIERLGGSNKNPSVKNACTKLSRSLRSTSPIEIEKEPGRIREG